MALANDLTPLINAVASDTVAESPKCNAQVEAAADITRDANVDRSTLGKAMAVRYPLTTGHASAGAKTSASTRQPSPRDDLALYCSSCLYSFITRPITAASKTVMTINQIEWVNWNLYSW